MQYELGDAVLFDGGPAKVIERSTEDRTYLIEFTGATGKRRKTVTEVNLQDAPDSWDILNHDDLVEENAALKARVAQLEGYFAAPDIGFGRYQGVKVAVLLKGPRTELTTLKVQYIEGPDQGKNLRVPYEEIDWIDPIIVTSVKHLQTLTDRIQALERIEEDYEQLKWKFEHMDDDTDYS